MYDYCQAFQCLPRAGGLLDQDAGTMYAFGLVSAARADKQKADEASQKANAAIRARKV